MVPRVFSVSAGLGSRDIAAGDLVAVFDRARRPRRRRRPRHYVVGIKHPLALPVDAARPPAGRRVQPPRPLDRRVRQRHDQQARGDPHRRAVREAGPGVPALRLGEEGPADDLLPDHRRRADPAPRRARAGRVRAAPRRLGVRASATRSPGSSTAATSSSSRRSPIPRRSGPRSRPRSGPRSSPAGSASRRSTRRRSRCAMRPGPTSRSGCRASPSSASSSGSRRSRPGPAWIASSFSPPSGDRLGRFFGKRGGSVVDANLEVIAEAYDGLIDVTAGHRAARPPVHGPARSEGALRMNDAAPRPGHRLRPSPTAWPSDPIVIRVDATLTRRRRADGPPPRPRRARRRRLAASLVGVLSQTDLARARAHRVPLGQLARPRGAPPDDSARHDGPPVDADDRGGAEDGAPSDPPPGRRR